jgi:hypothetical protein
VRRPQPTPVLVLATLATAATGAGDLAVAVFACAVVAAGIEFLDAVTDGRGE